MEPFQNLEWLFGRVGLSVRRKASTHKRWQRKKTRAQIRPSRFKPIIPVIERLRPTARSLLLADQLSAFSESVKKRSDYCRDSCEGFVHNDVFSQENSHHVKSTDWPSKWSQQIPSKTLPNWRPQLNHRSDPQISSILFRSSDQSTKSDLEIIPKVISRALVHKDVNPIVLTPL